MMINSEKPKLLHDY